VLAIVGPFVAVLISMIKITLGFGGAELLWRLILRRNGGARDWD
jgi:hypothetical protein